MRSLRLLYKLPYKPHDLLLSFSAFLLILGAVLISPNGAVAQIETLHKFWLGAAVMGLGFSLSWRLQAISPLWFWGVAILARLLLLPMEPGDDLWRYLWEGKIQTLGFSPYHLAPNAPELAFYRPIWWSQINHPDVAAIYPPVTQLGFRLLATVSPSPFLFKSAFVLADLAVCWLLSRRFGQLRAMLYAWNPMIIYAFAGGGHYDSWFILPLVAGWRAFDRDPPQRLGWSALWVGMSIAVKWISLPMLGFLVWQALRRLKLIQAAGIGLLGMLPMLLSALPFCSTSCPLVPTRSGFVSSGRSAELLPHVIAQIWPAAFLAANWIYLLPLGLLVIGLMQWATSFGKFSAWYLFGLLTLTPIVHFWYFTWLMPFAVPSQNWGMRWVSLSAFVYFILPSRLPDWRLTDAERLLIWLPFVLGWLWTARQNAASPQSE